MNLIIENIRTFAGRHEITIKPLTILVGENSSGKTTLLTTLSVLNQSGGYPLNPKFNNTPYSLGNYNTIATFKGGKFGRAKSFSIGWIDTDESGKSQVNTIASYINSHGKIKLSDYLFDAPGGTVRLHYNEEEGKYQASISTKDKKNKRTMNFPFKDLSNFTFSDVFEQNILTQLLMSQPKNLVKPSDILSLVELFRLHSAYDVLSIAPIRTRPERTYDQSAEDYNPEGKHIPYTLARILNDDSEARQKKNLVAILDKFGNDSGLFSQIDVKVLGRQGADPFQILVNVSGRSVNLLDVGYGVSQSLPVIIESFLSPRNKRILIQQPEVHLHPRAQAALGSFFAQLVEKGRKEFVIETHSDYIIDRIRQEVASGTVNPDDVEILYFERHGLETTVYPINIDKFGNVIGAPASYRSFFFEEEVNLLTLKTE